MKKDVAIIGISMQVAHARDLEAFWQLIEKGETGFSALSDIRRRDLFDRFGAAEIAIASYLDRIDLFDNEFFKISPAEAERMDPEQRLMLENAVKAVNNAGYLVRELQGKRIGVFHTYVDSEYRHFFDDTTQLSHTAHMPGMLGTRVAKLMDWRGPVIGINTSCSSSLAALYYACESVIQGDCIMALAGGVSLEVPYRSEHSPVSSAKGRCLPFDKDADGTLGGEGVFCVLVKRAEDAVRDGDPVHAIIKGGAMNHAGDLIQNISAPSPVSQSEVIRMAWQRSRVNPRNIRFVEAHGTGTVLGDPIEFMGIDAAFREVAVSGEKICSISSVKGQIGHLDTMAGLAGLARLVLALKNKKLLPQTGFKTINEQIDETDSPVSIQRHLEHWESAHKRLAGISSFGMTGTNVHMVLEEYVTPETNRPPENRNRSYAIKVGGATASKAGNIREYLLHYLETHPAINLDRLCYSVNKMLLDENAYARFILFRDQQELENALTDLPFSAQRQQVPGRRVFLFIPGILKTENMISFLEQCQQLSAQYQLQLKEVIRTNKKINAMEQSFLLHYCAARLLIGAGVYPDKVLGGGSGKLIALLLSGKLTMTEAISRLHAKDTDNDTFNRSGFIRFLDTLDTTDNDVFVVMGEGEMAEVLQQWHDTCNHKARLILPRHGYDTCLGLMVNYYNDGNGICGEQLLGKELFLHDLHLPLFESRRFWPNVKPVAAAGGSQSKTEVPVANLRKDIPLEEITDKVRTIWSAMLKIDAPDIHADFFELGGSSLLGLDVLKDIEKNFGLNLEYADIFDYSTVQAQATLIMENLQKAPARAGDHTEKRKEAGRALTADPARRKEAYQDLVTRIKQQQVITRHQPRHILLTGGTGFLGIYLIRELLACTAAEISCLVRAKTDAMAAKRLADTWNAYFPELKFDPKRLRAFKGDITLAGLGLSAAARRALSTADTVYHLAASVSHYGKAGMFHTTNVEGTAHLLEWSKRSAVECFNHFSTTAVSGVYVDAVEHMDFYETDLDLGQQFGRHLYPASKFKAEQYIREHRGDVYVHVFRIGNIGGDSVTGLFQQNMASNNFYLRLKTLADLGYYCDELMEHTFETSPVDIVSKTAVGLSLHRNDLLHTFHMVETNPLRLDKMVKKFEKQRIKLQRTGYDLFLKHVDERTMEMDFSRENTFLGIARYANKDREHTEFTYNREATNACLGKMGIAHTYDVEQYADTILKYCIEKDFIKQH